MTSKNGSYPEGINFELASRKRVMEPELIEGLAEPDDSQYFFVALLDSGDKVVRKKSQVEGVQTRIGRSGMYIVQFGIEDPRPGFTRAGSVAYFEDGKYLGEVKPDKVVRISEGEVTDAAVVSGFFLKRPPQEPQDMLLTESRERATGRERAI